ncbi:MAG: YihY/virulence factor BrkB family protein [Intrasporangium sp.]|uniref:YihY/virulence factor BrkB family protein n=1 Tax=Intrasporangium sp. TaxID=1925024 RepID=UPI002648D28F|nr:YihY/virulence factor BrkB family protein [Intrasporangium sp.]MDN5794566.1 YihY/virulence factor BrkB family protein [Intrasporangium sp.]
MQVVRRIIDWVKSSRAFQAWERYGLNNGNLLAAGVGYYAFFSIFPALAVAFTIFGFVLRGRPALLETIADSLNDALPGMVKTATNPDGIISLSAPQAATLTITGAVGFVILLWAGLGWISALRKGIRAIYGLTTKPSNLALAKLRDLGVLVTFGLAVAVSAILTSAVGGITARIADWVGLGGQTWVVTLVGLLISAAFDTLLMVVLLRLLSGAPLPWQEVRVGALIGGIALTVMKFFGGFLIARATSNPLLGAVAVPVGLLFWLNLMSRVVLLSAAWTATGSASLPVVRGGPAEDVPAPAPSRPVPYAAEPAPAAQQGRAQDRVSLAIGAVLGAGAALAWSAARHRTPPPS